MHNVCPGLSGVGAFEPLQVNKRCCTDNYSGHVNLWGHLNSDKRAMMALDRPPESFSPQMNYTSLFLLFQLVIPSFDPKGHHMNKIDKGLQGDATYQKSKLYPFQFQKRILKLVFFVPMFQLVTPRVVSVLTPKESYE